jgi:prepilin-type N-terminal cleavage/methylation domain-containing protein
MSRHTSISPRNKTPRESDGFTLLEMIVAMAVLTLAMVMVAQITSNTVTTTQQSHREMDVSFQARSVLDRLSANLNSATTTGGMTIAVIKNMTTNSGGKHNDGLAFIASARPKNDPSTSSSTSNIRCTTVGYRINMANDPTMGISGGKAPMLSWGSEPLVFPTSGVAGASSGGQTDMYKTLLSTATATQSGSGQFDTLAPNIFRFEVSLLLNDGSIVGQSQANIPYDKNFPAPAAGVYYLSLAKENSSPSGPQTYVKALIVGIAGLSGDLRQIVGSSKLANLADALVDPNDGQTPLEAWDYTSASGQNVRTTLSKLSAPVPVNMRVYQRYYYLRN